jgi:hypothetical protein
MALMSGGRPGKRKRPQFYTFNRVGQVLTGKLADRKAVGNREAYLVTKDDGTSVYLPGNVDLEDQLEGELLGQYVVIAFTHEQNIKSQPNPMKMFDVQFFHSRDHYLAARDGKAFGEDDPSPNEPPYNPEDHLDPR